MYDWKSLADRFFEIVRKAGGPDKSSENLSVTYVSKHEVHVHLGTYSIADWSRHTEGTFDSEAEAYDWATKLVDRAEEAVEYDLSLQRDL